MAWVVILVQFGDWKAQTPASPLYLFGNGGNWWKSPTRTWMPFIGLLLFLLNSHATFSCNEIKINHFMCCVFLTNKIIHALWLYHNLLQKSFMRFINKYQVGIKYGVQRHDNFFPQMLYFDNYVVCNINRDDVNKIVTPCFVKIENIAKLPLHKQNKLIAPFPKKSRTRTQSEVMLPLSQQASGEKVWVSNYEAYYSGNLPHIPKLTSSCHVHPFDIKNPKNHCFINVIVQIIYSVKRSTQQKKIVWKAKFQNAYSIQHIKHLVHKTRSGH